MQHLSEEELILHYYGEEAQEEVGTHVGACVECRERFQTLQRVLNSVDVPVPERTGDYGEQVWNRLASKLPRGAQSRRWWAPRKWAVAIVMAGLLVAAFVAGRYSPSRSDSTPQTASVPVRERILVVALGDHLESSQMVLAELVNTNAKGQVDITMERGLAETLLESNRLYRQTAAATGDAAIASVLDDLERVLLEIVHSPDELPAQQIEDLQQRIDKEGLLFKIRVIEGQVRNRVEPSTSL